MTTLPSSSLTPFAAVIVAAGQGRRFGDDLPKQYHHIGGKSVLRYSLEAFLACPNLSDIKVVIHPDHIDLYKEASNGLDLPAPIMGGAERHESVRNALQAFSSLASDHPILIHDAARPCIKIEDIHNIVSALKSHQAVTLAHPVSDTLRRAQNMYLNEEVSRNGMWAIQTPQGFHYDIIKFAHEAMLLSDQEVTDDTGLVSRTGVEIKIIEGPRSNIKITKSEDILMADYILNACRISRTAMGYDVHALVPGDGIIRLGGIDIPHDKKLLGHSDADVVLHAVTDALLGTIAAGDIGVHFPPSDMSYKDMDSSVFLTKSADMVKARQGSIVHLDITILGERPKISPYREAMQRKISALLSIPASSVSVKATTTEKLGFTGREEGIVAQAIATVSFPS